jgi:hypothetical protein
MPGSVLENLREELLRAVGARSRVGSEFPVQVGGRGFDLLLFQRELNCLVAIELKVGRVEPEYLGKLAFYVEALDRDVRKPHEIGVLRCVLPWRGRGFLLRRQPEPCRKAPMWAARSCR